MNDSDYKPTETTSASTSEGAIEEEEIILNRPETTNIEDVEVEQAEEARGIIDTAESTSEQDALSSEEEDTINTTGTGDSIVDQKPEKQFEEWIKLKEKLHYGGKTPRIRQGEVWWCSFGENVGVEINGKSARFTRPVLIMKKLSHLGFMGIPLTSQPKTGSWYASFEFLDKTEYAAVCQARVMSVSRLHSKIGELPMADLATVKEAFHKLYR